MKLTLIHGPAKCGKTKLIIEKFFEGIDNNPVIITSSSESSRHIKNLILSHTDIHGFLGHKVITFDHLVNMITEECKEISKKRNEISKTGKYYFIREIVNQLELKYFQPVKDYRGFYELLSRFISELKTGEITPEIFLEGITKKGPTNKDKELYSIYSAYQKKLNELNIYDHEGKFWLAQNLIENGNLGPLSNSGLIIFDGFQNFSPCELKIIQSIEKYVDNIFITLTLAFSQKESPHGPAFGGAPRGEDKAEKQLKSSIFYEESIFAPTIKTYNILKNTFANIEEIQLPDRGFQPKNINIISCPGPVREIEEIAREIKRLITYSVYKPSQIAVLFRDLTEYKELISEIFNRYGIPYSISEGMPLVKSPFIRNIIRIFESTDNIPNKAFLEKYIEALNEPSTWPQVWGLPMPHLLGEKANSELDAYSKLLNALNELSTLRNNISGLNGIIDLNTFHDILIDIADYNEYSLGKNRNTEVKIFDVHKARGLDFKVVFIGGLIEKSFPKQIAEEPFYGDIERAELRRFGIDVEEAKEKQKVEMCLFYTAVNTASELLYLTYPAIDNTGKEELTSYYVDEIKKIYPDKIKTKRVHLSYLIPEYEDVYTKEDVKMRVLYNYWNKVKDEITINLYKNIDKKRLDVLLKNIDIENNRNKQWNGIITDKNALEKIKSDFGNGYKFSVSQFNEYGTCPFSFFCKRLLRIEPEAELLDEILPEDEGNLYHAILREFYSEGGNIAEIAEKHFRITEEKGLIKNRPLWKIKREDIIDNIKNIIHYEADQPPPLGIKRTPKYFEIAFGMDKRPDTDRASVEDPLTISNIKIQGKIDRIDLTYSGMFVVLDYKSGDKIIRTKDILKGTNLQLPIYIMAAEDVLKVAKDALEGYFLYIKHKKHYHSSPVVHYKKTKKGLEQNPDWDEYMEKAREFVMEYAKNIRGGKFPPLPGDECPSYCDYKDICRGGIMSYKL